MQLGNVTGCKNAGCTKGNPGCAKRQVAYRRKVVNSDLVERILSNLFKQFPNMLARNGPNGFIPNWRLWIRRPGSKPEHVTINMDQVTPTARIIFDGFGGKVWLENSHAIRTQSLISWAYLYELCNLFWDISHVSLEPGAYTRCTSATQSLVQRWVWCFLALWRNKLQIFTVELKLCCLIRFLISRLDCIGHWVRVPRIRKALIYITWLRWRSIREAAGRWEEKYPKQEQLQLYREFPWPP